VGNLHFVTFSAGLSCWKRAQARLGREIKSAFPAATVWDFNEQQLATDKEFRKLNLHEFAKENPRGFGLWSWKPFLLTHVLNSVANGDTVFYLDAGVSINPRPSAMRRFGEYLHHIEANGFLLFQMRLPERDWTKLSFLESSKLESDQWGSGQILGGLLGFTANGASRAFARSWSDLATFHDGIHLKDPELEAKQLPSFKAHRHDQSLLSVLAKLEKIPVIPDETYFGPDWRTGRDFPLWATRKCSGIPRWFGFGRAAQLAFAIDRRASRLALRSK
jgi:hypothetical protein